MRLRKAPLDQTDASRISGLCLNPCCCIPRRDHLVWISGRLEVGAAKTWCHSLQPGWFHLGSLEYARHRYESLPRDMRDLVQKCRVRQPLEGDLSELRT